MFGVNYELYVKSEDPAARWGYKNHFCLTNKWRLKIACLVWKTPQNIEFTITYDTEEADET